MSETISTAATNTPSKAKARTASAAKKTKTPATHPPVSDMVVAAIKSLKERNGSSGQAIKKYIAANYKVEVERLQPFIKKFLKSAVTSGTLTQTKGKGANGSFKLSANQIKEKKTTPKTQTKPAPKKTKSKADVAKAPLIKTSRPSVASKTAKKTKTKAVTKSPKVKKTVEKKSKTLKTAKSPKKVKTIKPKPVKKTPKKAPQKSTRKA